MMKEHEIIPPEDEIIDTAFEDENDLGDMANAQTKIKKLREDLREEQKKRDEYLDGWQRCKADSINARKENFAEADRRAERIKIEILENLIPVLDSFDMATGNSAWDEVSDGWKSGIEQIRNQLLEVMARNGIERFAKVGEVFDPRLHEVIQEVQDIAGESHSIVKILRFGYSLGEKVLRPAQVFVKK